MISMANEKTGLKNVSTDVGYRNLLADSCNTVSLSDLNVEPADKYEARIIDS